ncbi:MAG: CapA family protein [Agathobacter sp.]
MKRKRTYAALLMGMAAFLSGCGVGNPKEADPALETVTEVTAESQDETVTETVSEAVAEFVIEAETQSGKSESESYDFSICFAGDISLADDAVTTQTMKASENGVYDCISKELIEVMQSADIMCLNNEFTYSTNGSPMEGKMYTFRGNPENVNVLKELGVDVVNLANNHVYDYGKQALLDTFDTLDEAEIPFFGAGRNLEEATEPYYVEIDGKVIAFVAASRAEKNKMTPQATEDSPGILRCYDTTLFVDEIREAKENADLVLAYVHWGTEYSDQLEEVQQDTAREYLDAGADVIIGAHPHCLQGMEYYDGKPIIYSLGNYWFNNKTLDTMLLNLHFSGDGDSDNLEVSIVPALQTGCRTYYVSDPDEQEALYSYLESISINVDIDENGVLSETVKE